MGGTYLKIENGDDTIYAPNFEKVGGGILVSACLYVCMYVRTYVFMFEISS